jgi:hypothetical protein
VRKNETTERTEENAVFSKKFSFKDKTEQVIFFTTEAHKSGVKGYGINTKSIWSPISNVFKGNG